MLSSPEYVWMLALFSSNIVGWHHTLRKQHLRCAPIVTAHIIMNHVADLITDVHIPTDTAHLLDMKKRITRFDSKRAGTIWNIEDSYEGATWNLTRTHW